MGLRTLGQKRAEFALERTLMVPGDIRKDFKSLSASVPSMILQNGFGQTLAFLLAKGTDKDLKVKDDDKHTVLFDMIKDWLSYKDDDVNNDFVREAQKRHEFLRNLTELDQTQYLSAQREALALLEWIKRFASAELD